MTIIKRTHSFGCPEHPAWKISHKSHNERAQCRLRPAYAATSPVTVVRAFLLLISVSQCATAAASMMGQTHTLDESSHHNHQECSHAYPKPHEVRLLFLFILFENREDRKE